MEMGKDTIWSGGLGDYSLALLSVSSMMVALYYVFNIVPDEQVMGAVQRIFYFHVGSALSAYIFLFLLFVASAAVLTTRSSWWDTLAYAVGEIAFALCSIVLATGMIWGHSAWNTWWRWEPQLVSFLVLWLVLFSYLVLRRVLAGDPRAGVLSAVVGIVAAINVPIVVFSVKLLVSSETLHPNGVVSQGLRDSRFVVGLLLATVAVMSLSFWILKIKTALLTSERKVLDLEFR